MPSNAALPAARPGMTPTERRATASLAAIYGLRLLGMFVILPVFASCIVLVFGMMRLLKGRPFRARSRID